MAPSRSRHRAALLSLSGLLAACSGSRPAQPTPAPARPEPASGGDRVPPPSSSTLAPAVALPAMPTCAAGELRALASLTAGLASSPALARREGGALAVFLHQPAGAHGPVLAALPLSATGQAQGAALTLSSEPGLAAPALATTATGYQVVFRATQGAQERLLLLNLGANGTPSGAVVQVDAGHFYGRPSLLSSEGVNSVAVARWNAGAPGEGANELLHARLDQATPSPTFAPSPAGGRWDPEAPVSLLRTASAAQLLATATHTEDGELERSAWLVPAGGGAATPLLRDVGPVSAQRSSSGNLLTWTTRQAGRDIAVRSWWMPQQGAPTAPPLTVSVFRGAFGAAPLPIALGSQWGVLTLSTLADDAGGTFNLAVHAADGSYLGRRPLLLSSLVRGARFSAAPSPNGNDAWVLFEARGDGGAGPALALTAVECDTAHPVDVRTVPPPTLVQQLGDPDEAPARIAAGREESPACRAQGEPTLLATHSPAGENRLADTRALAAPLADAAAVFVLLREGDHTVLRPAVVGSARAFAAPTPLPAADQLLAAGRWGSQAAALFATRAGEGTLSLSLVSATRSSVQALTQAPPGSAAFAQDGSGLFAVGPRRGASGELRLWGLASSAGARPRELLTLRPGDRVLDVLHRGTDSLVLLARPEALGGSTHALAVVTVGDRATTVSADPFADPVGYGTAEARWLAGGATPTLLWRDRHTVRSARFDHGELREARSVFSVLPVGGGTLLASAGESGAHARTWLALQTGLPAEENAQAPGALTLLGLEEQGRAVAHTATLPQLADAIVEQLALAPAGGGRVALVFARTSPSQRTVTWHATLATCTSGASR